MTDTPLQATVTQRGVVVTPDEQILIVQRTSDGGWELPGGRLDRQEDAVEGLARELREETALTPEIVAPVDTVAWVNDDGNGRFGVYYYCREARQSVSLSAEHAAAEWKTVQAASSRLSAPQTAAVEAAATHHHRVNDSDLDGATPVQQEPSKQL